MTSGSATAATGAGTRQIGILLFDGVEELDAVGPWEVLAHWTRWYPEDGYAIFCMSSDGRPVTGAKGLAANPNVTPEVAALDLVNRFDSVCPTSFSKLIFGNMQIGGYDAYAVVASCGTVSDENGSHSESTLIVQIKGSNDYYGAQWAVRGPASAQPMSLKESIWRERLQKLQPIKLCPIVPGEQEPYPSCAK